MHQAVASVCADLYNQQQCIRDHVRRRLPHMNMLDFLGSTMSIRATLAGMLHQIHALPIMVQVRKLVPQAVGLEALLLILCSVCLSDICV